MPVETEGCAARLWKHACASLAAPMADEAWEKVVFSSPPDSIWHSLRNCVTYQAGVWLKLLGKGMEDVSQPAAFKLALVLRHTPAKLTARLLAELLSTQPQSTQQELTSYVLTLLTGDEAARCGEEEGKSGESGEEERKGQGAEGGEEGEGGVPLRDRRLFGDCELAVLAASRDEYDLHAKLVRAEYTKLAQRSYVELRVKVLNQFAQIPKLFHTSEFECMEASARQNIERELCTLREHLLTDRA